MLVSLTITESHYPHQMTSEEINQALRHARALTAMNPPIAISRPLAIFVGQLLTELWRREETDDSERQITEFSRKELRDALVHVKALRALQPRQQIQVCMLDCLFAITAEMESRSKAKRNHAASVAKGLTDDWTASAGGS
jgi:hypothetical protein